MYVTRSMLPLHKYCNWLSSGKHSGAWFSVPRPGRTCQFRPSKEDRISNETLGKVQAFEYGGTVLRAILVWELLLQWSVGKLQTHETVPARRMRAKFGESCPLLCQQVESERNSSATASRDHRALMVHGLQGVILLCGSLLARPCHINP